MTELLTLTDGPQFPERLRDVDPLWERLPTPAERRLDEIRDSAEFGATFTDENGEVRSFAAWAPAALPPQEQLELGFKGHALHEAIRLALAAAITDRVLPLCGAKWIHDYAARLRAARQGGALGFNLKTGKYVRFWDQKAGLARYCPDDAREEATRVNRKYLPELVQLQEAGYTLYSSVLTTPNVAPGELRKGMAAQFKKLRKLQKAKFPDGSLRFPEIRGALVVQESPLGQARDWHPHLNVIFVVDGYLDYGKLRSWWHWNLHIEKLPAGESSISNALRELIKYAVAATVAKSADKAAAGETRAPPMLEWTGAELLEWMRAHRGFRRTRSYGCLFKVEKPKPEDDGPIVWLGTFTSRGGGRGYNVHSTLLRSIPEDKSTGDQRPDLMKLLLRSLAPGGLAGAGRLGEQIPPNALAEIEF